MYLPHCVRATGLQFWNRILEIYFQLEIHTFGYFPEFNILTKIIIKKNILRFLQGKLILGNGEIRD